ncbi:DUF1109 domain-containing protein [Nocardiopsis sp. NRRL B-16309]|uniref:DUF1109 domain-containing protein n=1 Tax=Nocardiopsis sp. NRRL B-16309 TaxID=1519494 RepID=UPI0006AE618C|nr:DUF1109 domain-containing protein [Nocardiopsis sp. NRRL B-16309]KOX16329.1 hypothetical protein ADL05_12740 [Nocardiopsis sp. NRRL B-16309]
MSSLAPEPPAPPSRAVHLLWLVLLGVPCALSACGVLLFLGVDSLPTQALGLPRPLWVLAAALVWSASGAALLWVLSQCEAPRPSASLAVLTLAGAVGGLLPAMMVSSGTPPGMLWPAGALVWVLIISGCAAVTLAASPVSGPWWVVGLVSALFLGGASIVSPADPEGGPVTVSAIEADYAAYPHDVVVIGDTDDWRPFEAQVYSGEFTVTYDGPVHVVVRSGPDTATMGGGPDPLRSPCNDIDSLCEESADGAYVLPVNGPSPYAYGSLPTDRIRTEVAPGLLVEVILGRTSEIRPDPEELVEEVKDLDLRVAEPEDLNAIARGVYEWNRPEPLSD